MAFSRTISTSIAAPPAQVYAFAHNPANLPLWAPGFVKSIANHAGQWVAETTLGRAVFNFASDNAFGVLDHGVVLPSGETFHNPMRVVANGAGSEILFTLFQATTMADADFERDTAVVQGDLETMKAIIEAEYRS